MKKVILSLAFFFIMCSSCRQPAPMHADLTANDLSKVILEMTDIMVHDVTNPPLAARFFAYSCLAGYEVLAGNDKKIPSMAGKLHGFPLITRPFGSASVDIHLAALLAVLETAVKLQPSGFLLLKAEQKMLDSCRKSGFSQQTIDSSRSYALQISRQILRYAKGDRYNRISNFARYTPLGIPGSWYPTPPAYMAPVEPWFNTVRPFTLDSCAQFKPVRPVVFSLKKNSAFYRLMLLNIVHSGKNMSDREREAAAFWDCNPFAVQDNGHMLIGLKKISPGAHWLGIAGIACSLTHTGFSRALEIHTLVAIGLMDSFICCWDEKYRSNRIRPETAIRKLIDPNWVPFLQTPPFPEYLSGHACISAASAVILTHYFGEHLSYTDNVETRYGLRARKFSSFKEAALEAGISRFYGGIHFKDAVDNGLIQGSKVGNWVLEKLKPQ